MGCEIWIPRNSTLNFFDSPCRTNVKELKKEKLAPCFGDAERLVMPFRLMGWNPRSTHPMPSNIRGSNLDISTNIPHLVRRNLYLDRVFPSLPCWMIRTHPPVWSCVQLLHAPPTTYSFIPSLPVLGSSGHLLQMAQGNIQWRLEANKRPPASDVSAGLGSFTRKETPKKQNPRVNPSYPPTPADSRGSASQRNYTQQVSSADAKAKMFSKFKKRERRKQSSCTSKEQASKKQKKKLKQLHAASRTGSKCQSTVAKARKLSKFKKRKRRKQSSGTSYTQQVSKCRRKSKNV